MDFVKIKGKDINDCFMQMKMKYGPEAHVYNQRVIIEGGLMGTKLMSKRMYEIEIGIPEQQASKDRVEKKLKDLKELLRQKTEDDSRKKSLIDLNSISFEEKKKFSVAVLEKEPDHLEEDRPQSSIAISMGDGHVKNDLPIQKNSSGSIYLQRFKDQFMLEGISEEFINSILKKTEKHLSSIDKEKQFVVQEKFEEILEDRISVDSDLFSGMTRGKRKVVFFHGSTGAGKTTSVAKLAAKYFLHMGRMVSIYTTDNVKIAGIEQLKRYAETMDIPFYAVKDSRKLAEQLHRDGSELILVDTAGLSHKSSDFLVKLNQYKDSFTEKDTIENILVLPATSSISCLQSILKAYEGMKYNRILISKLDEAEQFSPLLELADKYNKVFSYISIGQEVPFDMIPATKNLLSKLFVNIERLKDLQLNKV